MPPKQKYDSDYIKFGLMTIEINKEVSSQCVISATVLSNDVLKLTKFEHHWKTNYVTSAPGHMYLCW